MNFFYYVFFIVVIGLVVVRVIYFFNGVIWGRDISINYNRVVRFVNVKLVLGFDGFLLGLYYF